jgi:hypothetical protein
MEKEKRKAARLPEKAEVTLTLIAQDNVIECSKIIHHISKNISSGGMRVDCATMIPVNSKLRIDLRLTPGVRVVTAYGRVRWVRCISEDLFETGIEFVDTPEDVIRELRDKLGKLIG